jgi:two-component system, cell cycle sensor histidine kinase and response regulator CckA
VADRPARAGPAAAGGGEGPRPSAARPNRAPSAAVAIDPRTTERAWTHDFNNLLTAVIGTAEAALSRPGLDADTRADLECIREVALRGVAFTRGDDRDTSEAAARPPRVALNETIQTTARLLRHVLGDMDLTLAFVEPDGFVRIDPSHLDRVLLNLVINARHAILERPAASRPRPNRVTLRTGRLVLARPSRRVPDTIPPGDYLTIRVSDTGIGIPRLAMSRLFEPGFTTRRDLGGSGLGLASVRTLISQADGFLAVDSDEGRGTTVEIYLPRSPEPKNASPPAGASAASAPMLTPIRTALVVDDDLLVRRIAERILNRAGLRVRGADSAEAALRILDEGPCDLMVSDVAMAGVDGVALARIALARWPDIRVILSTGYGFRLEDTDLPRARVALLAKPYEYAELLALVTQLHGPESLIGST